ncbi:hypothetical protein PVBG_06331 [Plasmodium vivax Brazil I]|uniref:PIR Superfamily Protein n=1 Tax=Plasmodium vivax (strain Brazil I) TaxID=1033975 RepID=A0A0J9T2V8_PLAV1|nr:hypothetical protein PVBG_06331 [Plasmodium vivax Brazil I]
MGDKHKKQLISTVDYLPSIKRTNKLIKDIKFVEVMSYIDNKKEDQLDVWINNFKSNLDKYLSSIRNELRGNSAYIHCRDLNYILDTIIERIFKLNLNNKIRWQHYIQEYAINLLNNKFKDLNCTRKIYDSDNKYIHIKKRMYDLCEDIEHINKEKTNLQKRKPYCNRVISRILERRKELEDKYYESQYHPVFKFDEKCTIDYIMTNLSGKECNKVVKPPKDREQTRSPMMAQTGEGPVSALQTAPGPALVTDSGPGPDPESEQEDGIDDPGATEELGLGIDIPLELPSGEEPKLDTTYAAASLCGVSLIGAMIYKVK